MAHLESGDQKPHASDEPQAERFHEGKPESHQALDSKDERFVDAF
jgi:hypothetical protein